MTKIDHIIVISHTHWNPEWYSTFEEYRMRLVDFANKLLPNPPNQSLIFLRNTRIVIFSRK